MNTERHIAALDWAFLRRTVIATAVTSLLVGLFTAVYAKPDLGARYLLFSIWALLFFSFTGLIFKYLLVESKRSIGIVFVFLKLVSLAVLLLVLVFWPVQGDAKTAHMFAMLAGIVTPLIVVTLRAIARLMMMGTNTGRANGRVHEPASRPKGSDGKLGSPS